MTALRARWPRLALAAALATTACSTHAAAPASPTPAAAAASPAPAASKDNSTADIEALYRARMDSARMRYNAADVRFMDGMIMHHAQALVMAAMAPTHGASASVQTLAARITNAQNDEIRSMQQWLRDRGRPVPQVHLMGTMVMLMDSAGHEMGGHDMSMPGMLTPEQMAQLDAARGPQFDRLFLTYMIQHHKGAVSMVKDLFDTPGAGQDEAIFKYASDVNVDQTTEIARMERMLSQLPAAGGAR